MQQKENNGENSYISSKINQEKTKKEDSQLNEKQLSSDLHKNFVDPQISSSQMRQENQQSTNEVKIEHFDVINDPCPQFRSNQNSSLKSPKKSKKIQKAHLQKDQFDNSLYSNSNRKLISIILKSIQSLPDRQSFQQNYLKLCRMNGERQNIVILPFLVLDYFLKQLSNMYVQEINKFNQINFNQELKQKINSLFTLFRAIFFQFRTALYKKNADKNSHSEKTQNSYKIFIQMADFFNNKIPQIFLNFVSKKFQIQRQNLNFLLMKTQQQLFSGQVITEEEPQMKYVDKASNNPIIPNIQPSQSMQMIKKCEEYIETIFPFKERQISLAIDRFFSVRLGFTHLRQYFEFPHDYMLDIKKILFVSKSQQHKRESGRGKKAYPNQMEKIYSQIRMVNTISNEGKKSMDHLSQQFIVALMVISLTKQKHVEVLQNFLTSINRKIQYLPDTVQQEFYNNPQHSNSNQNSLKYNKSHYNYFINLLARELQIHQKQKIQKHQKKESKQKQKKMATCLRYSLQEWIYPPFFYSKNNLCKIQNQQAQNYRQNHLNLFRKIQSFYQSAINYYEGEIQEDGITLSFYQEQSYPVIKEN